jgi:hypothetical protein
MTETERAAIIEIWKTIVEVQKHFNDIEMKIRSLFVTTVAAIGAAQGFLLEKSLSFPLGTTKILYANFLPLIGVVAAYLFYFMDRYWYHRLLMGAVIQGGFIEDKYKAELPELGLGGKISQESPAVLQSKFALLVADFVVCDRRYRETKKLHSDAKIELFYKSIVLLLFLWFLFTVFLGGIRIDEHSLLEFLLPKVGSFLATSSHFFVSTPSTPF